MPLVDGCFRLLEGGSRLAAGGLALTAGAVLKVEDNCWLIKKPVKP